jgi:hypothetical protein
MADMTTVSCWKCNGSGNFGWGTCWGCNGTGTNTYTTAALNRRRAAAAGRKSASLRKSEEAQNAHNVWIIEQSEDQLTEWVREVSQIEEEGTIEAWVLNEEGLPNGESQSLTIEEFVQQMRSQARIRVALHNI